MTSRRDLRARPHAQAGQALVLLAAICLGVMAATLVAGVAGSAFVARGRLQQVADAGALAATRQMRDDFARVIAPPLLPGGSPNPNYLSPTAYRQRARARALALVSRAGRGTTAPAVTFAPAGLPTEVTVRVARRQRLANAAGAGTGSRVGLRAVAGARLDFAVNGSWEAMPGGSGGDGYRGPLAYRQGRPMRPDVAAAFDALAAAARAAGHGLTVNSAFRSDAEQQRLWAQRPDPKWVAPPGTSLHRYGTELDLGPPSAYGWLAANARRFGFIKRYAWEPWHFGFGSNPRDVPARYEQGSWEPPDGRHDGARGGVPAYVPVRFARAILHAADRWNVPAELLAAQLKAESDFDPNARSPAGALGIAQFIPGTARTYGLANPFDPAAAIDAQAHLMHDLIARFGKVELALAAYNAGAGAVERFGGVPPYAETRAYVARIVALIDGSLSSMHLPGFGLTSQPVGVRLVK